MALELTEAQAVTVAVFDALGGRVAVLHGGERPGVYVVRVTGETFAATRRATLPR